MSYFQLWGMGKVRAYAAIGLMLGLFAAPEFEPKTFRFPVLWQSFCGCACAALFALTLGAESGNVIRAGVAGLVLGMTSKIWLKHIHFP